MRVLECVRTYVSCVHLGHVSFLYLESSVSCIL